MGGGHVALLVDIDDFLVAESCRGRVWAAETQRTVEGAIAAACTQFGGARVEPQPPDGWLVSLAGEDSWDEVLPERARRLAVRLRTVIEEQTPVTASVAVSVVKTGANASAEAASEARDTMVGKVRATGRQLLFAEAVDRAVRPPDVADQVTRLLRSAQLERAVALVEHWVDAALRRRADPCSVVRVGLPALVLEVAVALDPGRTSGTTDWRTTLDRLSLDELAAITHLHERSHLHAWLERSLARLAGLAQAARRPPLVEQVDRLIARRYTEPGLTLGRAADELAVSPYHLAHVLQHSAGPTFRRRLTRHRVRRATGLLLRGDLTVAEVAERTGFSSVRQFRETMRRETGLAPSQLRARGPAYDAPGTRVAVEDRIAVDA